MSFYLDCETTPWLQSRNWHSRFIESAEGRARDLLATVAEGEIEIYDAAGRHVATITKQTTNQHGN